MVSSKVVSRKLVPYPVFCQGKNVPFFITVKILTFWKPHHVFPAKALFHSHTGYAIRTSPNGLLPPFSGREAPLRQATSLPPAALFPRGERFSVMAKKGEGLIPRFPLCGDAFQGRTSPCCDSRTPPAWGMPSGGTAGGRKGATLSHGVEDAFPVTTGRWKPKRTFCAGRALARVQHGKHGRSPYRNARNT